MAASHGGERPLPRQEAAGLVGRCADCAAGVESVVPMATAATSNERTPRCRSVLPRVACGCQDVDAARRQVGAAVRRDEEYRCERSARERESGAAEWPAERREAWWRRPNE